MKQLVVNSKKYLGTIGDIGILVSILERILQLVKVVVF